MNRKGFTLVELLVTMAILGIVTGLSIPLIRGLSETFEKKKFKTYQDALVSSAKLYTDSYSEDLFGHKEIGCAYVTYEQLEDKGLLKDIDVSDMSCNSPSTFVRVNKIEDNYSYSPFLGCGEKKNGKVDNVSISLPEEGEIYEMDTEYCTGIEQNNLKVYASKDKDASKFNKKQRQSKVTIMSGTGINSQIDIYAGWSLDKNNYDGISWKKVEFNNVPSVSSQMNTIKTNAGIVSTVSNAVTTPENKTGKYYLILRVDNLQDLSSTSWKNTNQANGNYLSFGPFAIDNNPPVIKDSDFTIKSDIARYNSKHAILRFIAKDTEVSQSELKYCFSQTGNNCTPTTKYKHDSSESNIKQTLQFEGTYNGETVKEYIAVQDLAGNITRKEKSYKLATKHTLKYHSETNDECNGKTLTVYHNEGTSTKWGRDEALCTPSKSGAAFTHWNTREDGRGDMITSNGIITKNLDVYAQWAQNSVIIKYNIDGGTFKDKDGVYSVKNGIIYRNGSEAHTKIAYGDKINQDSGLLNLTSSGHYEITKENYEIPKGAEWKYGDKTYDQTKTTYTSSSFCNAKNGNCTVELKANWKLKKPTCKIEFSKKPDGNNGWYKSPVTLTLKTTGYVSKKGLNLATESLNNKTSVTIDKETSEVTYYGKVENSSGSSTCTAKVKYDKTAPKYDYNCVCRNSSFSEEDYGKLTYFDKKVSEYKPSWAGYIKSGIAEGFTYALPIMYYDNLTRCYDQGDNKYYPCAKSLTIWYYDVKYDKPNPDKVNIYTGGKIADMPGSGNPMVADLYDICDDAGNCICKNGCNIRCNSSCTDYKPSPLRK